MFLMYVDECGDCGMAEGGSDYFILSSIAVHESAWTSVMQKFTKQREEFCSEYGMPIGLELHASEMMGRSGKKYSRIGKIDRLMMLKRVLRLEASIEELRIINVVVDKRAKAPDCDVFDIAWNTLIDRFENTIQYGNFPCPEGRDGDSGLIIVDETDEVKLRRLTRNMRHNNAVPSHFSLGGTTKHNLRYVIEDPLHKKSDTSMLIQVCDVNSYFLKQSIVPNSTIKKHKATNYFYILKPILLKEACRENEYGIVYR